MSSTPEHPFAAFTFLLSFDGEDGTQSAAFQEVSGLEPVLTTQAVNDQQLLLKRGLVKNRSALVEWFQDTLSGDFSRPIVTKDITLSLIGNDGSPLAIWTFKNAWPISWSLSNLASNDDLLAIETLQFSYTTFIKS